MEPNHYETPHPSGTAGGMDHKRRFWRGYILLEVFLIALAVVMAAYLVLFPLLRPTGVTNYFELVLLLLVFCGAFFVIPAAIGGLIGWRGLVAGAVGGLVLFMLWANW